MTTVHQHAGQPAADMSEDRDFIDWLRLQGYSREEIAEIVARQADDRRQAA
jgi:hypothetical protein